MIHWAENSTDLKVIKKNLMLNITEHESKLLINIEIIRISGTIRSESSKPVIFAAHKH